MGDAGAVRKFMYSTVSSHPFITSRVGTNVFGDESVHTPEPKHFIALKWGTRFAGVGPVTRRNLLVFVHDEPSDYTAIDEIIDGLRVILTPLVGKVSEDLSILSVEWIGDGDDSADQVFGTIVRTASFTVVYSGTRTVLSA